MGAPMRCASAANICSRSPTTRRRCPVMTAGAASIHFGQGLTFEALQRPEDAKRAYGRALALKPDFAPARDKLAALTGTVAVAATTRSDAAAEPAFRPIVSGNHPIVTGAIEGPDLVVRKVEQPQAVAPSQELLAASDLLLPPAVEETPVEPEIPAPAPAAKVTLPTPVAKPAPVAKVKPAHRRRSGASSRHWRHRQPRLSPDGWCALSQRDETTAWSSWKKLQASTGDLLANHEPAVVRADLGAKGIYFRLQWASTAGAMRRICAAG